MKICVATMFSPAYQELANLTVPNMQQYAGKHGYDTHIIFVEDEKWAFKKHEAFRELFEKGYDLIWYKDVDSVITNFKIPITDFIDDYYSFYLTKDFTELNGGSVVIKNTESGRVFNDIVLENRGVFENEQNFYNSMPMLIFGVDIMKPIPHPSINSYSYSLYPECTSHVGREDLGDWEEGHLLLHVPALSLEKRLDVLSQAKITE